MKKNIIVCCAINDCYWNIGRDYISEGNCIVKQVTINTDYAICDRYVERGKAQAAIARAAFKEKP